MNKAQAQNLVNKIATEEARIGTYIYSFPYADERSEGKVGIAETLKAICKVLST